jgi:transcriptional regulator of acetoin/glycerol metabolism
MHLPSLLCPAAAPSAATAPAPARAPATAQEADAPGQLGPIQANERRLLLQLLEQHRWNVSSVAKALAISRNTLYRKLHKLRIEVSHLT